MTGERKAIEARFVHDREVLVARVGERIRRTHKRGRRGSETPDPYTYDATVIAIDPDSKVVVNDGKGGAWHPLAQVHELEVTEWAASDA